MMPAMKLTLNGLALDSMARTVTLGANTMADEMPTVIQFGMPSMGARPIIGVVVDVEPRESDKYGAYVTSVTPGGPADHAGIQAGDIITKIDGKSLTARDNRAYSDDVSVPGLRLVEIAAKLDAGKSVDIELRRGTNTRNVKVTPVEDNNAVVAMGAPAAPRAASAVGGRLMAPSAVPGFSMFQDNGGDGPEMLFAPRGEAGSFSISFDGPLSNLELAPLNDKLGAYFGTSEGVLVVNTGSPMVTADSIRMTVRDGDTVNAVGHARLSRRAVPAATTLGLEPGDVVVSVDGRKVTTPSQLMRVLSTYDRGEEFKLQIMRQKRAETLTSKLP
jgi:membrane-associated protease RseP (regulator of RpoE activity)